MSNHLCADETFMRGCVSSICQQSASLSLSYVVLTWLLSFIHKISRANNNMHKLCHGNLSGVLVKYSNWIYSIKKSGRYMLFGLVHIWFLIVYHKRHSFNAKNENKFHLDLYCFSSSFFLFFFVFHFILHMIINPTFIELSYLPVVVAVLFEIVWNVLVRVRKHVNNPLGLLAEKRFCSWAGVVFL